jgi:hypothetical protein
MEIQFVPAREHITFPLLLFRQAVPLYCENNAEHTNTLCGRNARFLYIKAGSTYSDLYVLKC